MFTELELRLFKCFRDLRLPLAPLTLLSGPNASGKSAVLQSMVLLRETLCEQEGGTRPAPDGAGSPFGSMSDFVDEAFGCDRFSIGLADARDRVLWTFVGDAPDGFPVVESVKINGQANAPISNTGRLLPGQERSPEPFAGRLRGMTCLTGVRLPPRDIGALTDPLSRNLVGARGEHAASVLHRGREQEVADAVALRDAPKGLFRQVEARMRTFVPGRRLELEEVAGTGAASLRFRTSDRTGFHPLAHAGFGIVQCFPIVVAALSAADRDLLVIENPELGLHPAGQALMGRFLADVAAAGRQVLLETHSDHVLNGVRRAVKDGRLGAEEVAVHFFQPRSEDRPQVLSPGLDDDGRIDFWPPGFFDQFDRDANYFAGWSEGRD